MRALRRNGESADTFPQDVLELQGFLTGETRIPGVRATPGDGSNVPLYILGSSLFGAQLAAALGLPYAFASHFAPDALEAATQLYRAEYRPSAANPEPYLIVAANLIAAPTEQEAELQYQAALRWRAKRFLVRGGAELSDDELDAVLATPGGEHVKGMMRVTASGTPEQAAGYIERLAERTRADEVILAPASPRRAERIRAVEMVPAPALQAS
jgi:luciferase family oxidoreductase group 1